MSTKATKLELAERLNRRLLAASQLQIQAARSVAPDGGALGSSGLEFVCARRWVPCCLVWDELVDAP
jgi:hypothetical protein